jgi:hypothetical protein
MLYLLLRASILVIPARDAFVPPVIRSSRSSSLISPPNTKALMDRYDRYDQQQVERTDVPPSPEFPSYPPSSSSSNYSKTLYRRHLPSTSISFSSSEGRAIFASALSTGGTYAFFPLIEQLQTQPEPAYCGLTTLVIILNGEFICFFHAASVCENPPKTRRDPQP